jgi:hypothetical protein
VCHACPFERQKHNTDSRDTILCFWLVVVETK